MKITNAEIIKSGEKGLIETVTSDLNWRLIEDLLREKYNLKLGDGDIKYTSGDIVVHDNQVAYQLDFNVTVTLSVLLNREGECFDVEVRRADDEPAVQESSQEESRPSADMAADDDHSEDAPVEGDMADEDVDDSARTAAEPVAEDSNADTTLFPPVEDSPTPSQIADMIASINQGE